MKMNKIEAIYTKQKEFSYIKSINIYRDFIYDECSDFYLKLTLSSYPACNQEDEFHILFVGVKNLRLEDINNLLRVQINISSIKDCQIEDLNFKIVDNENQLFSFLCKDIKL